jgi:hypothetical protein
MDCIHIEFLDHMIKRYKRNIVNKLENVQLTEEDLPVHADILTMVLDYSPKLNSERRLGILIIIQKDISLEI